MIKITKIVFVTRDSLPMTLRERERERKKKERERKSEKEKVSE